MLQSCKPVITFYVQTETKSQSCWLNMDSPILSHEYCKGQCHTCPLCCYKSFCHRLISSINTFLKNREGSLHTERMKHKYNPYSPEFSSIYSKELKITKSLSSRDLCVAVIIFYNSYSAWSPPTATESLQSGSVDVYAVNKTTLPQAHSTNAQEKRNNLYL